MHKNFQRRQTLLLSLSALLLAACGGGGSDAPAVAPVGPSALQTSDTLVGAGQWLPMAIP